MNPANDCPENEGMCKCFECGSPAEYDHHVVPMSRGGTKTVPLCDECHGKAHHKRGHMGTRALTREALRAKSRRGEYTGGCPGYGKRLSADGVRLEDDQGERVLVERAKELRARGLSLRRVSAVMAQSGLLNRKGRPLAPIQIARMVADAPTSELSADEHKDDAEKGKG